jgi:hypothetical protein
MIETGGTGRALSVDAIEIAGAGLGGAGGAVGISPTILDGRIA